MYLYEHGKKILETYSEIKTTRKFFNFDISLKNELTIPLSTKNLEYLSQLTNQNLMNYTSKLIYKVNQEGFKMDWHLDDISLHKNSLQHQQTYEKPKYTFYCKTQPPRYTLILYLSDYGIDFEGGEFCFVDLMIKPVKGQGILFDSREVHQVKEITSGMRESILIKFYDNNR